MKVALIAPGAVPAVLGGAENLWAGLMQTFNRLPGVTAEFISPPSPETNLFEVLQGYQRFGELDLKSYDRVISTKYPAWACAHPNHTVYLQHTLRGLYDTYPAPLGFWLSPDQAQAMAEACANSNALRRAGPSLCRALEEASAPSWQLAARAKAVAFAEVAAANAVSAVNASASLAAPSTTRVATTARLAALLLQLLKTLQSEGEHWAMAYPGPFARACVRLLDAVALAPSRIRSYQAISQTVANRQDYFPPGVPVKVHYHPTALTLKPLPISSHANNFSLSPGPGFKRDILLAPSRLEPPKRMDMIIRGYAASGLSIPLWIVGTGPQKDELQALAAQTPCVEMKGFLSEQELAQAYNRAQFVVFAPQQEDFGLITVEAFKAAAPVLTCLDSGGPTELVAHGQSGYLAEPSVQGLAKGFQHLARLEPETREAMGKQGQHWVQDNLNWTSLAVNLLGDPVQSGGGRSQPLSAPTLLAPAMATNQKPKLLVLNTFPIEPVNSGGRQRMLGLYKGLSSRFDIRLISLSTTDTLLTLRHHAPSFVEMRLPVSQALQDRARYYETRLGVSCFDLTVAQHPELLREHFAFLRSAADTSRAIVFSHPYCFPLFESLGFGSHSHEALWTKPILYEAHNVEAHLKPAMLASTGLGGQFAQLVRSLEARLLQQATYVVACATADQAYFQECLARAEKPGWRAPELLLAPNGLDISKARFKSCKVRLNDANQRGSKLALFIGSGHAPNVHAANLILDAVSYASADWWFVILGSCCHSLNLNRLSKNDSKRVRLLGLVSEAEKLQWIDHATVGLNPMGLGSGSNLKVAEYVASGLGLISTEFGARGWNWQPNYQYLFIEPTPPSLSGALSRFQVWVSQQTQPIDGRLRQQAQEFDWQTIGSLLAESLSKRLAPG